MIEVTKLKKSFNGFEALKGIDLRVEKGEIYGFLGHNGAGKSTTMNILSGLSRADGGHCTVNGRDLAKVSHPKELHIGYLPEEPKFYPWMTAIEYLTYVGDQWEKTSVRKRTEEMLEWVGLKESAKRKVGGYSRGMKQRLGMAAALFYDSQLLLLDEPSSALDPEGRSEVLRLIVDLKKRGKTVFLSTHILSDAERVCDRVGILTRGEMTVEKPLFQLLEENVQSVFEIECMSPVTEQQVELMRTIEGVTDVKSQNMTMHVTVEHADEQEKSILRSLSESSFSVQRFSRKRASLEDIFLGEVNRHASKS